MNRLLSGIFAVCLALLYSEISSAQSLYRKSPFNQELKGWVSVSESSNHDQPFLVNLRTVEGVHQFVLKKKSVQSINGTTVELFQGERLSRSNSKKRVLKGVAASRIGNRLRLDFVGRRRGRVFNAVGKISKGNLGAIKLRVVTRPSTMNIGCAGVGAARNLSVNELIGEAANIEDGPAIYSPPRVIELSTDTDSEFYQRYKEFTFAEIQSVLNAAEAIYLRQIGLRFKLVSQHTFQTSLQPYSSSDPFVLLEEFRNYTNRERHLGKADLYHLFTGKKLKQNIVGLAYVGAVCTRNGDTSFGISEHIDDVLYPLIVAHEIGHGLGATHHNAPNSVMSTFVGPGDNTFSERSLGEIVSFIDQHGWCLSTDSGLSVGLKATFLSGKRSFNVEIFPYGVSGRECKTELYVNPGLPRIDQVSALGVASYTATFTAEGNGFPVKLKALLKASPNRESYYYFRARLSCLTEDKDSGEKFYEEILSPTSRVKVKPFGKLQFKSWRVSKNLKWNLN